MKPVEAMRRALAEIDGTIEPWADHHYRDEAIQALGRLEQERCLVVEHSFAGLVNVARKILDESYPADVFVGRDSADSGVRFVTRLRDALAQVHAGPWEGDDA